jgi:hypothetical protein
MNEAVAAPAIGSHRFDAASAMTFGVLWGIAASALTLLEVPSEDVSAAQLTALSLRVVPVQCIQGLVLVGATMALGRRLAWRWVIPFVAAFSVLTTPVDWLFWVGLKLPGTGDLPTWAVVPQYAHGIWHNLVVGILFVAAFRLNGDSERGRRLFAAAEIARQESDAWLAAERIRALRGHVDPALLLRVMVEVERRYARDAEGSQRLLDALVGMLRAAMPGVRSGASTLDAEVLLARRYAGLRDELDPGRATWQVRCEEAPPSLPFPPLLLLPVLDQLIGHDAIAIGATEAAELHVESTNGQCTLRLTYAGTAHGPWLAADLLYRLQVGLRSTFGTDWTLDVHDRPDPGALVLTLSFPKAAPSLLPTHQEAHHE